MTDHPALAGLRILTGAWTMELSDASFLPDPESVVKGSVTFDWIEDRAALVMRMGDRATWIIGRDDAEQDYHILYGDGRGVSRVYRMSLEDGAWRIWRFTAEFSQRFEAQVDTDRGVITGHWEKSHDAGVTWEHDFNVRYTRSGSP